MTKWKCTIAHRRLCPWETFSICWCLKVRRHPQTDCRPHLLCKIVCHVCLTKNMFLLRKWMLKSSVEVQCKNVKRLNVICWLWKKARVKYALIDGQATETDIGTVIETRVLVKCVQWAGMRVENIFACSPGLRKCQDRKCKRMRKTMCKRENEKRMGVTSADCS